jgi:4-amino-4-deoxy-L-arabinose transferase-like glycosyltransferase
MITRDEQVTRATGTLALCSVVTLGALIRLFHLARAAGASSLFMPDAAEYRQAGVELFQRGQISSDIVMPLYPAWTYITGGHLGLQIADIALSALTIALIFFLTLAIFESRRAAMLSAVIAALYPFFIYYAPTGVTETFFIFLLCAAFLSLYRNHFAVGSVLLVLAILVRPAIAPLAPILVLAFSRFVHGSDWQTAARRVAVYLLTFLVLMSPWWIHNYNKYGTFVATDLGAGKPFYYGNVCPEMDEGVQRMATGPSDCTIAFGKIANPIARNDSMQAAAFHFARENPAYFAKLLGVKFVAFWRPWVYTPSVPAKLAALLSYGVILVASLLFLIFRWKIFHRRLSPVILLAAYLCVIHTLSYSYIRYRLPVEPFMISMASFAIVSLRNWRSTANTD